VIVRSTLSSRLCTQDSIDFCGGFGILAVDMPIVKCPHCSREVEFSGNEFRPFCSERCKLLDFGAWADEEYNIPTENQSLSDEDIDAIEKASGKQI